MMSPVAFPAEYKSALPGLPEFEPDPALWGRIHSANVRRVRRRRVRLLGVAGMLVACVATSWFFASTAQRPELSGVQGVAFSQAHSQQLQDQWLVRADEALDPRIQARLRLLDSDLQAAYDRGASEPELTPLWMLRNQLLQSLVQNDGRRSIRLTRI